MSAKIFCDGWQGEYKCKNEAIYCTEHAVKFSEVEHKAELAALNENISALNDSISILRAIIKEQQRDIENVTHREAVVVGNYQRTVEAQAWQLAEARKIISVCADTAPRVGHTKMRAWLAANAPAPQAEQANDDQHCPLCTWRGPVELVDGVCPQCDVNWPERYRNEEQEQGYREALEKIESIWVGESVTDEHIAALKMYTVAARVLNNADVEQEQAT